jgi:general secretion pathway protein A
MYEQYWGLTSAPFANRLAEQPFFAGPHHEEALARLLYSVEQNKSLALLHGPAGCGKSQLLCVLSEQVRRTQRYLAAVYIAQLNEWEFLGQLERELRLGGTDSDSLGVRWRRLMDFLRSTQEARLQTVLVLDGVEQAEDSVLLCINRIVGLSHQSLARLTVVAGLNRGTPSKRLKHLFDAADMGIEIKPLERQETESYIHNRLESFGGRRNLFQTDAIDQLQKLSGGVPREINRLCELALLAAMNESRNVIDRNLIASLSEQNVRP